MTLLRAPTDLKDITTPVKCWSFYPTRFLFLRSCRTLSSLHTGTWPLEPGNWWHMIWRGLGQCWLEFAFISFSPPLCSKYHDHSRMIMSALLVPPKEMKRCLPVYSKLCRFAWKHCKSWKLFSYILNSKRRTGAMLLGWVQTLALSQYHVRMRCEHGAAPCWSLVFKGGNSGLVLCFSLQMQWADWSTLNFNIMDIALAG